MSKRRRQLIVLLCLNFIFFGLEIGAAAIWFRSNLTGLKAFSMGTAVVAVPYLYIWLWKWGKAIKDEATPTSGRIIEHRKARGPIAQLAEHLTLDKKDTGSTPVRPTNEG